MAWTEDGYEEHVLEPRRALRARMAERLDNEALKAGAMAHTLRRQADLLRLEADGHE